MVNTADAVNVIAASAVATRTEKAVIIINREIIISSSN